MNNTLVNESNETPIFQALNMSVMPIWLAMIVAPRSKITARLVATSDVVLAGLSAAYVAQLAATVAGSPQKPDFGDIASLRASFARPGGFLTGWTHFLAFDLFVGRWIWRTSLDEGRTARLATFLTLMTGPAGLGLFGLQRRLGRGAD